MNGIQKVILSIMPRSWRESAEAESKQWMVRCPNCRAERTYWEAGGIRWLASGNKTVFGKCPACGQNVGFQVYKKETG